MQLEKIKLAGFKSFVDPTTVLLPSNLVAIVGPNGCGKSNIIDAICWVMGESSAKYLRGELLTDVIFNGSSSRKPVGQASVELVFDNQDGSLGGEYASYSEISIKRLITRDGDSHYTLNGARCRRRDIIDIFLGTGLGPRSYSIIGQNMISRLIEAKPDEMRVYLEEAAGVSKYKERRRETENRIKHTKENLERLNDVRVELERQLGTLKRQSNAAERYKLLKQEERTLKAQWHAIQWRHWDSQAVQYSLEIQQQETGLEANQANLSTLDKTIEQTRNEQHLATEYFQEIQQRFYLSGNEITRMEKDLHHQEMRVSQLERELASLSLEKESLADQLHQYEEELTDLSAELTRLTPEFETSKNQLVDMTASLKIAEESMQKWQANWDDFNRLHAKASQTAQVEQTRIQHLEQKISSTAMRNDQLAKEQSSLSFADVQTEIATLSEETKIAQQQTQQHEAQLSATKENITNLRLAEKQTNTELDQIRNQVQKLRGNQSSLEALQQTALGQRNNQVNPWLAQHQLARNPRLGQHIDVVAGWETAVEKVLGAQLQAVCIDDIHAIKPFINELKKGSISFITKHSAQPATIPGATALLTKITSEWPLESLLSGIYTAESLDEALTLANTLASHESVILPDGTWINASWLKISNEENPAAGIFQREGELKQLASQISQALAQQELLEKQLASLREQIVAAEKDREQLQISFNQSHAKQAEMLARLKMRQERLAELTKRSEAIAHELTENVSQLETSNQALLAAKKTWQEALTQLEEYSSRQQELAAEKEQVRQQLQSKREQLNNAKDISAQLQIRTQTSLSQQGSLQQTIARMHQTIKSVDEREQKFSAELQTLNANTDLKATLKIALEQRLSIESELSAAREKNENLDVDIRNLETQRQQIEKEIALERDALEKLRLNSQSLKVKAENALAQISEIGLSLEEILLSLPENADMDEWAGHLEQVSLRINRLGPINLIAIEEYATCSERKTYLDQQYDDLQDGLNTLENAIAKIDGETRTRFKATFDQVNEHFTQLFPNIFGGGKAYLELTGDNLLDAGITVMACPPGKRNSTIHLLSGGEKALTAIALVFSIFQLNPAPFCLLDEVDAPLDDANIARFCKLVKDMSQKTQFIFISHNKIAIEMGEHLMGVTMHEPGVSRMVSVDMKEAITLAGVE